MLKIKLIIFSVVAVAGLQGSHNTQDPTLTNAIYQAFLDNDSKMPVIIHSNYTNDHIKAVLDLSDIKGFLQNDVNQITECIVLSDTDLPGKPRDLAIVKLGKSVINDPSHVMVGDMQYERNQIRQMMDKHEGIKFKKPENNLNVSRKLAIFNMYHAGEILTNNRFANEIKQVIGNIPAVIIIGQKYNGVDIEKMCENDSIISRVLNKPKNKQVFWWKNHWKELVGIFSFATFLVFFCYFKFIR